LKTISSWIPIPKQNIITVTSAILRTFTNTANTWCVLSVAAARSTACVMEKRRFVLCVDWTKTSVSANATRSVSILRAIGVFVRLWLRTLVCVGAEPFRRLNDFNHRLFIHLYIQKIYKCIHHDKDMVPYISIEYASTFLLNTCRRGTYRMLNKNISEYKMAIPIIIKKINPFNMISIEEFDQLSDEEYEILVQRYEQWRIQWTITDPIDIPIRAP
jgi:hypothetical protein